MSDTYTPNLRLRTPALADRVWNSALDDNRNKLDGLTALGGLAVVATETPSSTLHVQVSAGTYRKTDGTVGTYAGTASLALSPSTTTCLWLVDAGTLTTGAAFPSTAHIRLATVVTGTSTVTSVTDNRLQLASCGTGQGFVLKAGDTLPASNFVLDTTVGTQLGTAAAQKLAFHGATPVIQRAGAAQTALTDSTGGSAVTTLVALTNLDALTDSTGGTGSTTFAAITAGASYAQADMVAVKNALSQIATEFGRQRTWNTNVSNDISGIVVLLNEIRAALVEKGIIKGSA